MGQSPSYDSPGSSSAPSELDFLHEQIRKHSLTLRQLTFLTYDQLVFKIEELNTLSSKFEDCNGKQLLFEVKPGTDSMSVLWKGTIRIKCVKLDPRTHQIEKSRELNLKQFLQVYNTLQQHLDTRPTGLVEMDDSEQESASSKCFPIATSMNSSLLFDKVAELDSAASTNEEDCCICMERKPEVSLPCTHSYCLTCIERWNVNHKTCPTCRERLENTDQTWVLEDRPNDDDVSSEIRKSLFSLTR